MCLKAVLKSVIWRLSNVCVSSDLQWTTVGECLEYWSMCSLTRCLKPMRSSVVSGTPWSGQAVKWKWRTERVSAVFTWRMNTIVTTSGMTVRDVQTYCKHRRWQVWQYQATTPPPVSPLFLFFFNEQLSFEAFWLSCVLLLQWWKRSWGESFILMPCCRVESFCYTHRHSHF